MSSLAIDPGLLRRLREAGGRLRWAPLPGGAARLARLGDEEARAEVRDGPPGTVVEVAAGPVGAVVLLLEADRRGPPSCLGSRNAGRSADFPDGSIFAAWGPAELPADARPTVRDLVELARYALP
jgi:hypothetical protein